MQAWTASNLVFSQMSGGVMSVSRSASPNGRHAAQSGVSQSEEVNIYALPPEKETRELIEHYFSTTGVLFPYLHEPTFWKTYEEVKRNRFTKVRRTWLGLLNIVLALAASARVRSETTSEDRVKESDTYYQRAVGLCDRQILRASSLEAVHLLLVMGQYLQGTQKSVQAWTIHGLTVKAALQLGLHSSEASKRFSPFEQEIRKRTWTLSMTFGRPGTIPDDYVKLPMPAILEEDLSSTMRSESTLTDSLLFFNSTMYDTLIDW
ncbi:Lactose regulatory protein [Lachnellula willkommii]|uniref:Lactose regulatory protein n=1 Tax=Lachnellula willkommii TaxID=215461 RepID=A0A559MF05_9HELO|nr:Lactose regulatory protein [Lachnellula willkommii]